MAIVVCSGLCVLVFGWVFSTTKLAQWQWDLLHWNYASHALLFALPTGVVVVDPARKCHYALKLAAGKRVSYCAILVAAPLLVLPIVGHLLTAPLRVSKVAIGYPLSTLVYQLVFVAVAEELFFRGFFQGELNRAFDKPFKIGNTRFGFGLLTVPRFLE
ncbi:MAG: CPBP family glutamic-type intramembrane protease [Planctomycetota bacterium]